LARCEASSGKPGSNFAEHEETILAEYIALIHKDADSDYGVSFPDFPGCITAGSTLDEARAMAAEALAFHIEGMREDGQEIPSPSLLAEVMRERTNRDAVAFLVAVPDQPERNVRVNVMLPEGLLRQIDARTDNRSKFLAQAAVLKLRGGVTRRLIAKHAAGERKVRRVVPKAKRKSKQQGARGA
jgi:predicted RNase H-like HicB family nuclease